MKQIIFSSDPNSSQQHVGGRSHEATMDWETSFTPGNRRSRAAASSVAAPYELQGFPKKSPKSILKWIFMYFFYFCGDSSTLEHVEHNSELLLPSSALLSTTQRQHRGHLLPGMRSTTTRTQLC